MAVTVTVNPSWRIKSNIFPFPVNDSMSLTFQLATPCEYYRKGRCIFGEDRCNFLHVMNDWNPDESTIIEPPKYLKDAPTVNIFPETPPSASLRSVRSPPRSPRTADLLLALRGAIVQDDDDDEQEDYIDDLSFEAVDDDNTPGTSGTAHPEFEEHNESEHATPSPTHSGLLSPVEFSDLQLKHLSLLQHSRSDSKSKDHKQSLSQDSSQWASPLHMARSPPRSPAPSSTFGLIASPFGSPSTRFVANSTLGIMSPRLGPFLPRTHIAPSPLATHFNVQGQEPQPEGPDVELDSPTNYYQEKKAQEAENARLSLDDDEENDEHRDDDEDYSGPLTAIWDAEDTIRPFFLEPAPPPRSKSRPPVAGQYDDPSRDIHKDVKDALRSRSASPLEYFQTPETVRQPPPFDVEDVQANSTFASEEDDEDETAQLGYLRSSPDEDDTINSLYDVYSDIESESEHSDEDEEEDLFISRLLPSRLSSPLGSSTSTSAVYSPLTALPRSNESFTPPRTAFAPNFSLSTAQVFTRPDHASRSSSSPSRSLASLPTANEASNEPIPLPFPGFSSSGRRESKLRPLRLVCADVGAWHLRY